MLRGFQIFLESCPVAVEAARQNIAVKTKPRVVNLERSLHMNFGDKNRGKKRKGGRHKKGR